ncbi:hypothetical protein TNCV_3218911 [Trichonephila clavipes]|nr:hypothetical protein TNCV_3218911 [Trichonephila clavipes]
MGDTYHKLKNSQNSNDFKNILKKELLPSDLRTFGDEPRNFESWSSDESAPSSPNYYTNERTFELTTNLTRIAPQQGGSSVAIGWNS